MANPNTLSCGALVVGPIATNQTTIAPAITTVVTSSERFRRSPLRSPAAG